MNFRHSVDIAPSRIGRFGHQSRLMLWGSCFADHLSSYLEEELYHVSRSPYGIAYNPISLYDGMDRLLRGDAPREEELILHEGRWHSMSHHGSFSRGDRETTLRGMRDRFDRCRRALEETDLLVLTLGTAWVYEMEGRVVSNCHKLPERRFTRRRVTPDEIVMRWSDLLRRLRSAYPSLRILLTVSPVPHYRDGAHESRLSKAVLLLAVDRLCDTFADRVDYFPTYEILQDELRDYRFYADDMTHPSPLAIAYIMDRFRETYLLEERSEALESWRGVRRRLRHRPLTDDPAALSLHYTTLLHSLEAIRQELPTPYLEGVIDHIRTILHHL